MNKEFPSSHSPLSLRRGAGGEVKKPIYILTGPPASGKTTLAMMMASVLNQSKVVIQRGYNRYNSEVDESVELVIADDVTSYFQQLLERVTQTTRAFPNAVLVLCITHALQAPIGPHIDDRLVTVIQCGFTPNF